MTTKDQLSSILATPKPKRISTVQAFRMTPTMRAWVTATAIALDVSEAALIRACIQRCIDDDTHEGKKGRPA